MSMKNKTERYGEHLLLNGSLSQISHSQSFSGINKIIPNKDWYLKGRKRFYSEEHTGEISGRDLRLFPVKINSFKFEII